MTDFNFVALSCDTDGDGVNPTVDIDDDNDGLTDVEEYCAWSAEDFTWHGAAAANITNPNPQELSIGGARWSNAYSDQILNIPLTIEGTVTNSGYGMVGIIPATATETTSWNDGGYKFQCNLNAGMYVRHGAEAPSGWISPTMVGNSFKLEVSETGVMNYWHNGTIVYTSTLPDVDYEITLSRGSLIISDFTVRHAGLANCDSDNDGVFNSLDLDSDNDGIYDVVEGGDTASDTDVDGNLDVSDTGFSDANDNGMADATEATAPVDSDADGNIDAIELDSDGDGCLDVREAKFTDINRDGRLGPSPIIIDVDGLVTSGSDGYTGTLPAVTDDTNNSACPPTVITNRKITKRVSRF